MNAFQIFTDQGHVNAKREVFESPDVPGALKAYRTGDAVSGGFYGFGVALTGSSCYLIAGMEPEKRRAFLESIYGKNGLGLSVARVTVGSSDYSAELYSYDDVPDDAELKHFSVERDERYVIPVIKEILDINPGLYVFSSPWSPPGWMKTGGNMCGGYMRQKYLDVYADYYVKYVEAYASRGIKISALTPQNEPRTEQNGRMPACVWHPEFEGEFVKILRKKLDEKGLDTKIWLFDHSFDGADRVDWQLSNIEGLEGSLAGVAFHYYGGTIEQTLPLTKKHPGLEFHFTEGGPRLYDNYSTDFCKWATMMIKTLNCGYRSFTGWNLMLDELGSPNIGPFFCGGLVTKNSVTGEISYSGQYRAFERIAKYVTPDSVIVPLGINCGQNMFKYPARRSYASAVWIMNKDVSAFVFVNPDSDKLQLTFDCGGKNLYVELPPDSVSTVIIDH